MSHQTSYGDKKALALGFSKSGSTNELRLLLQEFPNCVNETDWSGDSLLAIACWHGQFEVVKMLVDEFDLNINKANSQGCTALHRACIQNNVDLALWLCQKGADVLLKDNVLLF